MINSIHNHVMVMSLYITHTVRFIVSLLASYASLLFIAFCRLFDKDNSMITEKVWKKATIINAPDAVPYKKLVSS